MTISPIGVKPGAVAFWALSAERLVPDGAGVIVTAAMADWMQKMSAASLETETTKALLAVFLLSGQSRVARPVAAGLTFLLRVWRYGEQQDKIPETSRSVFRIDEVRP